MGYIHRGVQSCIPQKETHGDISRSEEFLKHSCQYYVKSNTTKIAIKESCVQVLVLRSIFIYVH